MWKDLIVEETRNRREELARRFNYDIKTIGEALRQRQKARGLKPLTRSPRRVKPTPLGINTSEVEIRSISAHGLWLLAGVEELFLSYEDFPWFRDASVGTILNVTEPTPGHFYWPDLDVDLGVETIRHPDRFPLQAQPDT